MTLQRLLALAKALTPLTDLSLRPVSRYWTAEMDIVKAIARFGQLSTLRHLAIKAPVNRSADECIKHLACVNSAGNLESVRFNLGGPGDISFEGLPVLLSIAASGVTSFSLEALYVETVNPGPIFEPLRNGIRLTNFTFIAPRSLMDIVQLHNFVQALLCCQSLRELELSLFRFSDEHLEIFVPAISGLPHLKHLTLEISCGHITDAGAEEWLGHRLKQGCTQLQELTLYLKDSFLSVGAIQRLGELAASHLQKCSILGSESRRIEYP